MGGLNVLGVILAFIMFIESATSLMWEFFPAIIPSDLLGLVNMVPSTYQAILLFMLFQKEQNGETRGIITSHKATHEATTMATTNYIMLGR